ncbi:ATP-binding protein [Paludibaculum fermentans]|uniref:sensor histidine kinase n=1 Tax=Paludibaculum fermentans TaxID=1473598 RepID=UPI003EB75A35
MRIGLRGKSVAFLVGYTLVLEGSGLVYFYVSGRDALQRATREEVAAAARLARGSVERSLSNALAELGALRPQLLMRAGGNEAGRRAVLSELAVGEPGRYARLGVYDPATRRMLGVRAVREFRGTYPVADDGMLPGGASAKEGEVRVSLPLDAEGGTLLLADVYLDGLLDPLSELGLPAGVGVLATDSRGLILAAPSPHLLRTYLRLESLAPGGAATCEARLTRPELRLVAYKDNRAQLAGLRRELARVATFAAAATALGLAVIWALTGRMARVMREIVDSAGCVAGGDFSPRIGNGRDDELGDLIASINAMTERLEGSYRELTAVNLKLRGKVRALTRTRQRLLEKERMAAMGEALSKVSHEIQNKVGGVGVWVQNLERAGAKDETTRVCAAELRAGLDSMLEMLVHFKRFYRMPVVAPRAIEPHALLRECVTRATSSATARGVELQLEAAASPLPCQADPAQLADAITNLVLNAVEASGRGGAVEVDVRSEEDWVAFTVRDRGPGLPETKRIFRPFFTTKAAGSGLGLAIAGNIAKAHGGRVRAWNREAGGACFELRIPAHAGGCNENPAG